MQKYLNVLNKRLPRGWNQLQPSKHDNIIIAMSSGVDSSVAAALYSSFPKTRGVYMRNWSNVQNDISSQKTKNCDEKDWNDAQGVAKYLNIPLEMVNFEKEYWIDVFEPMLSGYESGRTPNPDLLCNRYIKFGSLKKKLDEKYGIDNYWLVTGHYSRILQNTISKKSELWRGLDPGKDQSYYLSQVERHAFKNVILPIGHFYKKEVREIGQEINIPTASKPDSQGICFVNNSQQGKFKKFLREYLPIKKGNIITIDHITGDKHIWGQHDGLWSYTIGQKIGIAMPQGDPAYKGTWFVSKKLQETNEIVIVRDRGNPELFRDEVKLKDIKWQCYLAGSDDNLQGLVNKLLNEAISKGSLFIQYRSLQEPIPVKSYHFTNDGCLIIYPETSQRAMAPGQYGCLYLDNQVLGSGQIS